MVGKDLQDHGAQSATTVPITAPCPQVPHPHTSRTLQVHTGHKNRQILFKLPHFYDPNKRTNDLKTDTAYMYTNSD